MTTLPLVVTMTTLPSVVINNQIYALDMAAKLDDTADYLSGDKWKVSDF